VGLRWSGENGVAPSHRDLHLAGSVGEGFEFHLGCATGQRATSSSGRADAVHGVIRGSRWAEVRHPIVLSLPQQAVDTRTERFPER
jgi:hypothetical protein